MKKVFIGFLAITTIFLLAGIVNATELAPFPSTNDLNANQEVPGREGQTAPYVEQVGADVGSVDLVFYNYAPGLAFFENRIDGVQTGTTPHPLIGHSKYGWIGEGDTIHTGGVAVSSGNEVAKTFYVNELVEIRLCLGGERDWDFDWTPFYALQPVVDTSSSGFSFSTGIDGQHFGSMDDAIVNEMLRRLGLIP